MMDCVRSPGHVQAHPQSGDPLVMPAIHRVGEVGTHLAIPN